MRYYGPQVGGQNLARFKLAAFDALYDRMSRLPDGPERGAFRQAKLLAVAYMPYKVNTHRVSNDLVHPCHRLPPASVLERMVALGGHRHRQRRGRGREEGLIP